MKRMEKNDIKVAVYKEVEIYYREKGNTFHFKDENGVAFESDSLRGAKQVIGSWDPKTDKQQKQKGLRLEQRSYGAAEFHEVEVGAFGKVAQWSGARKLYVWITDKTRRGYGSGRFRTEVESYGSIEFYKDTPANRKILTEFVKLAKELDAYKAKVEAQKEKLLKKAEVIAPTIADAELPEWN